MTATTTATASGHFRLLTLVVKLSRGSKHISIFTHSQLLAIVGLTPTAPRRNQRGRPSAVKANYIDRYISSTGRNQQVRCPERRGLEHYQPRNRCPLTPAQCRRRRSGAPRRIGVETAGRGCIRDGNRSNDGGYRSRYAIYPCEWHGQRLSSGKGMPAALRRVPYHR